MECRMCGAEMEWYDGGEARNYEADDLMSCAACGHVAQVEVPNIEDIVDEGMQNVTAFILENEIDSPLAREFVRQTAERAERRLHVRVETPGLKW